MKFVLARLKESSTYRGAILLLTALGVYVRPEVADAVTALGLALAGLVGLFVPDAAQTPAAE